MPSEFQDAVADERRRALAIERGEPVPDEDAVAAFRRTHRKRAREGARARRPRPRLVVRVVASAAVADARPWPRLRARGNEGKCNVCISDMEEGEELTFLGGCAHAFHSACVEPWLDAGNTCPTCRAAPHKTDPPPQP